MPYIKSLNQFVPSKQVPFEEIEACSNVDANQLRVMRRIYGLDRIAIAECSPMEMFDRALTRALDGLEGDLVAVLHVHTAPGVKPFEDSALSKLPILESYPNVVAFGSATNNCASLISALEVADAILSNTGSSSVVAICACDVVFTECLRLIPGVTVCGDSAGVILIANTSPGHLLKSLAIETYGQHAAGAWQKPHEFSEFSSTYTDRLCKAMSLALKRAGLEWSEVSLIFPHNVNLTSWREAMSRLGLSVDKVFLSRVKEAGHCYGADTIINWMAAEEQNAVSEGEHVMLATVGLGAVFAAAIFEIVS